MRAKAKEAVRGIIKDYGPYLAVVLAIIAPWFAHPGYLFLTDFVWGPAMRLNWTHNEFFQLLLVKALDFVLPLPFIQKLFVGGAFFTALMGGRKIAAQFLTSRLAVFAVSLFAIFNPFVYDRALYGQLGIVYAAGFFMLAVGYLIAFMRGADQRGMVKAGLWSAFAIQFSLHFIYFCVVFFFLACILHLIERRALVPLIKNASIAVCIVLALNANVLIGLWSGKSYISNKIAAGIGYKDLPAFQTSGATGADAAKNVFLMSGFWGKDQRRYLDLTQIKENWGKSFFLLFPLILAGFLSGLRSRNRYERRLVIGLATLIVVSAALAVGIRLPFIREGTYWLFDHLPFYKGMRETQKWVVVIVAAYMALLSLGVRALFATRIIKANRVVSAAALCAVIVMQAPFMLFGFGGQARPKEYPPDWYATDRYLVERGCEGRVFFLPWHLYMTFGWLGDVVANPADRFFHCTVLRGSNMEWGGIYDNSGRTESGAVTRWRLKQGQDDFLTAAKPAIAYVILAKDSDWQEYSWIDGLAGLEFVSESETLKLYRVIR